jgi:putative membrane protein insertion efficiency factor
LGNLPRLPVLLLIRLYQNTLSRALPPDTCRFYPSCSHYGYQSVFRFGLLRGGLMAVWRILRCNPFNQGGYDPVPDEL